GGVGGLLAVSIDGAYYFPCYDANGNVTAYVAEDGTLAASYTYDAFGNAVSATGPLADAFTHRFSTKPYDPETSLYCYGYRFYSPSLGRFLNRDPIEESGGANLYAFCANDPVSRVDKLGLASIRWWSPCNCAGGAARFRISPTSGFPGFESPSIPNVGENSFFGPQKGSVLFQNSWFENNYKNLIRAAENKYVNSILSFIFSNCGKSNLSFDAPDSETRIAVVPYYNAQVGRGASGYFHSDIVADSRFHFETEWGGFPAEQVFKLRPTRQVFC
ncbi:MAG: RHS repeat-associated core domain-containing protein, partial [Kiritimatiellae bacterium]|nr:RHS repeat-associated core domain-containing protein [Kiritimatiellia bacterium]